MPRRLCGARSCFRKSSGDLVHSLVHDAGVAEINLHEAKTHLPRLLLRVAAGEEIVIAQAGKPPSANSQVAAYKVDLLRA